MLAWFKQNGVVLTSHAPRQARIDRSGRALSAERSFVGRRMARHETSSSSRQRALRHAPFDGRHRASCQTTRSSTNTAGSRASTQAQRPWRR